MKKYADSFMVKFFDKKVEFKRINDWAFQPVVSKGFQSKTIPLLLELPHLDRAEAMLGKLEKDIGFDLFVSVVAGCLSLVMKTTKI